MNPARCWCGNTELAPFSPEYAKCEKCQTLISLTMPDTEIAEVNADEQGRYGRDYWFAHQEREIGDPNIIVRAKSDLPERCMHWLRTVLKYKLPPGNALEVGAAHGGFVALLRQAGFDASGLELSPWVVEFARRTFGVPMLHGPVERQSIPRGSLDLLLMIDVIEHLPSPLNTLRHCLDLLQPNGVLIAQMPSLPVDRSFDSLVAEDHYFLNHIRGMGGDHLHLFSPRAAELLFSRLGARIQFEPAIFPQYDMFFVATRGEFSSHSPAEIEEQLFRTPGGRMIAAMLDLAEQRDRYLSECNARLAVIESLVPEIDRLRAATK